jgi:CheY-like chemotaxis protein
MGVQILAARDGQEGVDMYRKHAEEISVVLLDLTMPRLSGEQVFEELKKIRSSVRVVLSTGYSEEDAGKLFAGKGLVGFIHKPYRITEFKEKMLRALSGA